MNGLTESELGAFLSGLVIASIFWLVMLGADNVIRAHHIATAETKCEPNLGIAAFEGHNVVLG